MKNKKLVSLLLSVVIAFAMWMYVITEVSPDSEWTYYDIPVIMEGETLLRDERNLIVTSYSDTHVDLTLAGNRSNLNDLGKENIVLKADMTRIYDPGTHIIEYDISYLGNVASNAFTRVNQYPSYITATVERLERKEVPVMIIYQGKAPEGYVVRRADVQLDHEFVVVTGPASVVEQITQAIISVDLTDQTESISENYRYTLCNQDGQGVDSEMITVNTEQVHMDLTIHRKKQVELTVTVLPGGGATENDVEITLDTESIQVSGSDVALEQVGDSIHLGTINLADYETSAELIFNIPTYEGVTNDSSRTEVVVNLRFVGLMTKEIMLEEFEIINVPEGLEASVITEKLSIKVRGPTELVSKLTAKDIIATVDFAGEQTGDATLRVNITFSNAFKDLGVLGKPSVTTSLHEAVVEEP